MSELNIIDAKDEQLAEDFYQDLMAVCEKYGIKQWFFGGITNEHDENGQTPKGTEFSGYIDGCPEFLISGIPMLTSRLPADLQSEIIKKQAISHLRTLTANA